VNLKDDLESVAAIISNLDIVISISSFSSPFAQALGIPVKLVGHKVWTMLGKDYWPWYQKVDLYCTKNNDLPISTVLPDLRNDLLEITKK